MFIGTSIVNLTKPRSRRKYLRKTNVRMMYEKKIKKFKVNTDLSKINLSIAIAAIVKLSFFDGSLSSGAITMNRRMMYKKKFSFIFIRPKIRSAIQRKEKIKNIKDKMFLRSNAFLRDSFF